MLFLKRFWILMKIMFPALTAATPLLFVFLLALLLLEQVIVFNVGLLPSRFYNVLGKKDVLAFKQTVIYALILIVSIALVKSTHQCTSSVLYISWRKYLCEIIHNMYFLNQTFYRVNVLDNSVDNPDQRMTQDVEKMCRQFSRVVPEVIIAPFTIAYYTYQAWKTTGWLGPTSIVGFFIVSSVINKLIMSAVIYFVVQQERQEGNFRFKHMQIRANAESAAFSQAGPVEETRTNAKLNNLLNTQAQLINRQYALNISVNLADYLGSILSYIVLAVPIFAGAYDYLDSTELSALISENAFVCIYLISCFTRLIDLSVNLTDIAGTAHRIGELMEVMNRLSGSSKAHSSSDLKPSAAAEEMYSSNFDVEHVKVAYRLTNVSYSQPGSEDVLVKDFSYQIVAGCNLIITGDSSSGKTSFLRVLCNLWPITSGSVMQKTLLGPSDLLFLPQKPFFTDGSLRQQVIYPHKDIYSHFGSKEDTEIMEYLHVVDMVSLLDRTGGLDNDPDWNWYDVLSPGEMQRLSFVRLFFHSPVFAALDEATSAVSVDMEKILYDTCKRLGITLISVGHRKSVRQFHDYELRLDGKGGWSLSPVDAIDDSVTML